jgi:GxxExxY protein
VVGDRLRIHCAQYAWGRVPGEGYENASALEVRAAGLSVAQQCGARVYYRDVVIGESFVDLLVEDVLVELKTVKALDGVRRMQCINYLKATGRQLCLLLNFGKSRLEIRRVAHDL